MSDLDHTYCSRCQAATEKPEIHNSDKCANILRDALDTANKRVRELEETLNEQTAYESRIAALEKERDSLYQTLAHTVFERDVLKKRLIELEGKQNG